MSVEDIDGEARALAKIRYNHRGDMCTLRKIGEDTIEAVFDKPQRAATPGQALVFYDGDYVMGAAPSFDFYAFFMFVAAQRAKASTQRKHFR